MSTPIDPLVAWPEDECAFCAFSLGHWMVKDDLDPDQELSRGISEMLGDCADEVRAIEREHHAPGALAARAAAQGEDDVSAYVERVKDRACDAAEFISVWRGMGAAERPRVVAYVAERLLVGTGWVEIGDVAPRRTALQLLPGGADR